VGFQGVLYEDFDLFTCEEQWDFKAFYMRTLIYSLARNEASYLEHIAPIFIFSIYSVGLELYDRKVYFAHLC
jgi:hypothetical protein